MFSALLLRADIAQKSRHVRFVRQVRTSPTERSGGLPSGSDRPSPRATSYLREDLKHVAVRVAEENRTMAEGVIGQR